MFYKVEKITKSINKLYYKAVSLEVQFLTEITIIKHDSAEDIATMLRGYECPTKTALLENKQLNYNVSNRYD